MPRGVPLPVAVPLAVAGGTAGWLAFPSPGLWWAAPLAVAALCVAAAGRRPGSALVVGLVFGLAFEIPLLRWTGVYLGLLPWLSLAVLQALFLALLGLALSWAARLPLPARRPALVTVAVRALVAAGAWVAVEALLARQPFGGFGWSRLAFSQSESPLLGLARLGGAPLLTFAVALAGALLAHGLLALRDHREDGPAARGAPVALAAALGAVAVAAAGLLVPLPTDPQDGVLRVAGIQGDVAEPGLEFNAERRAVLDNHVAGTLGLAERVADGRTPAPDLVVWPENASDIDPLTNPDAFQVITGAVDAVDAPTLVGTLIPGADGRIRNTTLVWLPGSGPVPGEENRYEKRHPVPFAEYVPYRDLFRRITPLVDLAGDMAPGTRVGLLEVGTAAGTVPVGDLICFEVVDDDLVGDVVDAGAQVVVVQTNNATFGDSDESVQQLAMSRVRAVEHGRAVAHVSTVGVSAMILPDGSVVDSAALLTAGVVEADLPLRDELTPASRLGAWPEVALGALGVLGVLAGLVLGRRPRHRPGRPPGGDAPGGAEVRERIAA